MSTKTGTWYGGSSPHQPFHARPARVHGWGRTCSGPGSRRRCCGIRARRSLRRCWCCCPRGRRTSRLEGARGESPGVQRLAADAERIDEILVGSGAVAIHRYRETFHAQPAHRHSSAAAAAPGLLRRARCVADGAERIAFAVVRPGAVQRQDLADAVQRVEVLDDAAQVPGRDRSCRRPCGSGWRCSRRAAPGRTRGPSRRGRRRPWRTAPARRPWRS